MSPTASGAASRASQKLPARAMMSETGIGAQHVERAVGQVHDVEHAEDQRQPDRQEEEEDAIGQTVQGLGEDLGGERHGRRIMIAGAGHPAPARDGQAGKVQPVPGSRTSATLSIGTLLRPSGVSFTSRM